HLPPSAERHRSTKVDIDEPLKRASPHKFQYVRLACASDELIARIGGIAAWTFAAAVGLSRRVQTWVGAVVAVGLSRRVLTWVGAVMAVSLLIGVGSYAFVRHRVFQAELEQAEADANRKVQETEKQRLAMEQERHARAAAAEADAKRKSEEAEQ